MPPYSSPSQLREIAAKLRTGDDATLSSKDAAALAAMVERQLQRDATAFGEQRRLIVEIRTRYFRGLSANEAAYQIAAGWRRYDAGPWLRERREDRCPKHRVDKIEGAFWELQRLRPRPLSPDRIRKIVGQFEMPNGAADDAIRQATKRP